MSRDVQHSSVFGLMVVRDAADLLEINLRHHAREGVGRFLVLDHQSRDNTPQILERWAATGLVEWDRVEGPFRFERWINDLAFAAYLQGAQWVLPIDADELWTSSHGKRLADVLAAAGADVLEATVLNFVQERDQERNEPGCLSRMVHRVERLTPIAEGPARFLDGTAPLVAIECPTKHISRAHPALWIRRGNHEVERPGRRARRGDLLCLHAPLRSKEALAQRQRSEGLADPMLAAGDSWHWRRWSAIADPAALEAEWRANSVEGGALASAHFPLVVDRRLAELAARALDLAHGLPDGPPEGRAGVDRARSNEAARTSLRSTRQALDLRTEGTVVASRLQQDLDARGREIERLRAELVNVAQLRAEHEAQVAARLAVLGTIEASRAHRLWMTSIHARRALRRYAKRLSRTRPRAERRLRRLLDERGYLDPLPVFDSEECRGIVEALRAEAPAGIDWDKDTAATSRRMYELAAHETITRTLAAVLGEEVMLWGASIVVRRPGDVHPWHTDIESAAPEGGTVSVWLGLENVTSDSSLLVVEKSHRFGEPLQKVAREHGRRRGEASDQEVELWAQQRDRRSRIVQVAARDGEALFFDGRLWHASRNGTDRTRVALLLQYATPGVPIRILDPAELEWPFRLLEEPRPRCLLLRGSAAIDPEPVNRFVAPPPEPPRELAPLHALTRQLDLPLAPDRTTGWRSYPLFSGSTPNLAGVSCHVSVLSPGCCPHPPHQHREEEVLVLLDGAAELVLVDGEGREEVHVATPGALSYYPSHRLHTLRTTSGRAATYLMLRWTGRRRGAVDLLPAAVWRFDPPRAEVESSVAQHGGFAARTVFEGATGELALLHCHTSAVAPGAGYEPHVDQHDVVLVVMSGAIETLGGRIGGHGVVFVPAGVPHGLRNPGLSVASYLVFELHGSTEVSTSA